MKRLLYLTLLMHMPLLFASEKAFQQFATRLLGKEGASHIKLNIKSNSADTDYYELKTNGGNLYITASDLPTAGAALNHYLKAGLNSSVTGNGSTIRYKGGKLPALDQPVKKSTPLVLRNYMNYCTFGYTMAFWDWKRWEQEIDWMLLNGINQPLMIIGCEKVWQNTLRRLNFTEQEILDYLPSSAYTAWWLMGNLEGEGGPLTQGLIDREYELGKRVLNRMRELGMEPILQGFVGLVPRKFSEHYPDAHVIPQGMWAGPYPRPSVLSPTDPKFAEVAKIWYEELHQLFGAGKYYGGDLFHEGGHSGGIDLGVAAKNVYNAMHQANPESIWVMQAWGGNPSGKILQALKPGQVLVQALAADVTHLPKHNYHGHDWTWNIINNFGGNDGIYGNLENLSKIPETYVTNTPAKFVGLGNVSEGMLHNPAVFELLGEAAWETTNIDLTTWFKQWIETRYGKITPATLQAWEALNRSVYSVKRKQQGATESLLCARPNLHARQVTSWSGGSVYYNMVDVIKANDALLKDARRFAQNAGYQFDVVDTTRQLMQCYARMLLKEVAEAAESGNQEAFRQTSGQFLQLILDSDQLLGTHPDFRFENWLAMADARGKTAEEKALMHRSAKQLLTTWIYRGSNLNDYGHRQWSGLMRDFYHMRWSHYFNQLDEALSNNRGLPHYNGVQKELDWVKNPYKPSATAKPGHPVKTALAMHQKYAPKLMTLLKKQGGTEVLGKLNWSLKPGDKKQTFTFDLTRMISSTGKYTFTFEYNGGNSALKILNLRLHKSGKTLASSDKEGWTGSQNRNNRYQLEIKEYPEEAGTLTLTVQVEGASSTDSRGTLTILQ